VKTYTPTDTLDRIPITPELRAAHAVADDNARLKAAQNKLAALAAKLGPEAAKRVAAAGIVPPTRAQAARMTVTEKALAAEALIAALSQE
jgi:hypothetical protein